MDEFHKFNDLPTELRLKIWKYTLPGPRIVNLKSRAVSMTIGEWEDKNKATRRGDIFAAAGLVDPSLRELISLELAAIYSDQRGVGTPLGDQDPGSPSMYLGGWKSDSPPPSTLSICRESYEVASKSYQKSFSAFGSIPETWFDFDADTLYFSHDSFRRDDDNDKPRYIKVVVSILDRLKSFFEDPGQDYNLKIHHRLQSLFSGFQRLDDLKRVRHLAVAIEHLEGDFFEDEIINYLEIFTGLSTLTIVADHYDGEVIGVRGHPNREADDSSDLSLMEPFDADRAFEIYRKIERNPSLRVPSHMPDHDLVVPLDLKNPRKISNYRSKNFGAGWKFPKIEYKVAITGGWKAYLDDLHSRCETLNAEAGIGEEEVALSGGV